MATGTGGFQAAMQVMRKIAAASTCGTCGLPTIAVATAWRGRGTGRHGASHYDATAFTTTCDCVRCGGCGAKVGREQTVERLVERAPGADPEPVRVCPRCAAAIDGPEAA